MKKISYLLALALAASCTINGVEKGPGSEVSGSDLLECQIGETVASPTKIVLSEDNVPLWCEGDAISILSASGKNAKFTLVEGEGTAKGTFRGTLPSSAKYTAIYPYSAGNAYADGAAEFNIPQNQNGAGSITPEACAMVASFTSVSLKPVFRNVLGLLEVPVSGTASISKITLTSNSEEEILWGRASLAIDGKQGTDSQTMTVENNAADANQISLVFASPVKLNEGKAKTFFFTVPVGTLASGFSVTIYDAGGLPLASQKTEKDQTISRSKIRLMAEITDVNSDPSVDAKPEPFTWAAYNSLRRDASEATVINPDNYPSRTDKGEKYVGIFYFVWKGAGGDFGGFTPINIQNLLGAGNYGYSPNACGGSPGMAHHWGEAYLGYYVDGDEWVFRKHAQMLVDAGVDFIYLDYTNGIWYDGVVTKMLNTFLAMRQEGNRTPQVSFMFANGHDAAGVDHVASAFYNNPAFEELWFKWEGKPLLLAIPQQSHSTRFTFRRSWYIWNSNWQTNADAGDPWWGNGEDKWPWGCCYTADNATDGMKAGTHQGSYECASVMPATHPVSNIGRSFIVGSGCQTTKNFGGSQYIHTPEKGIYFKQQFAAANAFSPKVMLFTGWNEWVAQRGGDGQLMFYHMCGIPGSNNTLFVDQYNHEFSRDIEPLKGDYGDSYYYYMVDFIRQFKGADNVPVYSKYRTIDVADQSFAGWASVASCWADDKGDVKKRNCVSWDGVTMLTNEKVRNDLRISKVATDGTNIYFYINAAAALTGYASGENGLNLFISTSAQAGWEGFDFRVSPVSAAKAKLSKSTGAAYSWEDVADVDMSVEGSAMQVAVPLAKLGITTPSAFSIEFKWVDYVDLSQPDGIQQCMRDGDSAPNGRFRYRYVFSK